MPSTAIPLIVPAAGGNGNGIANGAATPVVQTPGDPYGNPMRSD